MSGPQSGSQLDPVASATEKQGRWLSGSFPSASQRFSSQRFRLYHHHDRCQTINDRYEISICLFSLTAAEYRELTNNAPAGILAGAASPRFTPADLPGPVDESNFFEWECYISGPEGTPFEGGVFPATLSFPKVSSL